MSREKEGKCEKERALFSLTYNRNVSRVKVGFSGGGVLNVQTVIS